MLNWITNFLRADDRTFGVARSPIWYKIAKDFVRTHPKCEMCMTNTDLNVHHIQPFHLNPLLELDTTNLMTLCRHDHFLWGHFGKWASFNKDVKKDISDYRSRVLNRP